MYSRIISYFSYSLCITASLSSLAYRGREESHTDTAGMYNTSDGPLNASLKKKTHSAVAVMEKVPVQVGAYNEVINGQSWQSIRGYSESMNNAKKNGIE